MKKDQGNSIPEVNKKEQLNKYIDMILENVALEEGEVKFFEDIKKNGIKVKEVDRSLTDRGREIIDYMNKDEEKFENRFLTSDIAEGIFVSSNRVSGAILKLVRDGYLDRDEEATPMVVSLNDEGRSVQ